MMRAGLLAAVLLFACGPSNRGNGDDDTGGGIDSGNGSGSGSGSGGGEQVFVYAHSPSTLYKIDPDTLQVQMVGAFNWGSVGSDQMTDIAIDKNGQMIGVSFTRVYRVDPSNAATTLLSSQLVRSFNGLSFVPAAQLGMTGDDVLVGTQSTDGAVYRIDPMTGAATQVGNMGAYTSSGDLVGVAGFGTVQTVNGSGSDVLARLATSTFAASPIGTATGFSEIWGVAFFKDKIYGFTNGGAFLLIDPNTGAGTMVSNNGIQWWGAAVTTTAPVIF
ncbi:MAG TPA: hypothetical protein VFV99_00740 [Kofleriaceae bacterium]|nr:hypothetical protein [Kofleriaceae bacterium]